MEAYQAGLDGVVLECKGSRLLCGFYRAAGVGPRPTAVLLHGLPGVEKNLDIAYGLRDAGWNCLYFHYRGSWGSGGVFSLAGRQDDLVAITEWVVQQPCVDAQRLALVGHSAGGYLALMGGASDLRFRGIVALCPLISPGRAPLSQRDFDEFARMLDGISGRELKSQYDALPPVESAAAQLRDRHVLVLTGAKDDVFPHSHYPPLIESVPTIEWHEFSNGDHFLSLCRQEAVRLVVPWLAKHVAQ